MKNIFKIYIFLKKKVRETQRSDQIKGKEIKHKTVHERS